MILLADSHDVSLVKNIIVTYCGPGSSNGEALGFGLDGPGSIPGVGGLKIFLDALVSRLVLESTQPPTK